MTEILVESLDVEGAVVQPDLQSTGSIQMHGFAADGTPDHADKTFLYRIESKRERASSKASASLRSEPDLDTIMPLPGSAFYKRAQGDGYQRLPGEGSDTDSEGGDGSPYSPTIASFTTVEVG